MILYPDIQTKVQQEIDKVIGTGRMPTMKDRDQMPYTEATLNEIQRRGNIVLFSAPRWAAEDTTICGHFVPKGTWIFMNRWGMHASPRYWQDPEQFNPSRFLDQDGKVLKPDAFVPFGVGKHICYMLQIHATDSCATCCRHMFEKAAQNKQIEQIDVTPKSVLY